ncbi:hypothetical protein GYMLUDRAFT_247390 [Collybiopsis luxurians FD-317 M1]|uniref:FAD-binding domain-containing protein n=1 Tax=Collybiopsis luxurians FD-317 M1 TaxID=944289 RepID=A0A0D0BP38_9AGAR|nr:hypothetical protein GYMLUDRAFT_247390 [Collybiopsis luxurians FD-317 M1]
MSSTANTKKLRLAIIGGGVGGLTLAVALRGCSNIEVNLYEQAHQITEVGAGIAIWRRTWEIIKSLGLGKEFAEKLEEEPSADSKLAFEFRLSDRQNGFTFEKFFVKGGTLLFHRQDILGILLNNIPDFCRIHLSPHLMRSTCDILVGADGVKSVTRQALPTDGLFYSGTNVIRGLIPRDTLAKVYPGHRTLKDPVIYCGKNQSIVAYPIIRGQIINVAAFISNVENEGRSFDGPVIKHIATEAVVEAFSGWEDEVVQLLKSIDQPTRWALPDFRPMSTYVTRRIALLGDAAHAMLPHLGSGMGQAIEDGYILARLFSHAEPQNWLRVLEAYNLVRHPFGNMVKNKSREQGFYYTLNASGLENVESKSQELAPEQINVLGKTNENNWSWLEDDADKYLQRAIKFLKEENLLSEIMDNNTYYPS